MSVKYKLYQIVDPRHPSRNGKWFAKTCTSEVLHTKDLAQEISKKCTVTEVDTLAVLSALKDVVKEHLKDGRKVVLDGFGYFHIGIKSVVVDHPDDFKPEEHIKRVYTNFVPAGSYDPVTRTVHRAFNEGVKFEEMQDYPGHVSGVEGKKP
ncbi:HU family DNA-binding protein [Prevotella cerevisiae]|jgi:predicted histone-like DNA-binding protein|uniref:HU family DNA-binding protein n=1 Tax=Segatella cerevisiae TaxID=2053716 RepID=A0ABT1BZL1_9BACT|nr:HU family DNA-binding protein [Segatella cerevisiae]MCH3995064.1 HU family DNA-binding protein [Prevotella sp.]MCO6025783.1 HU family DNA-binding protein [Segatella cerevisiae]